VRRILTLLIAALTLAGPLAACGEGANPDAAPPGSEPQPEPPPGPVGPAASVNMPFAGGWATSRDGCSDAVWTVRADGLETPGEVSCQWNPAEVRSGGEGRFAVAASCSAENPPEPTNLAFRGDGQNLTIEGAPFEAVPLVRCTGAEG
jgi:hypothetical protein